MEDLVAEALRVGIEIIGQEYVVSRMGSLLSGKKVDVSETVVEVDEKNGFSQDEA